MLCLYAVACLDVKPCIYKRALQLFFACCPRLYADLITTSCALLENLTDDATVEPNILYIVIITYSEIRQNFSNSACIFAREVDIERTFLLHVVCLY